MELNRCQKLFFALVKNWIEAKKYFLPQGELNQCQKLFFALIKNWTEAKRFVRVQKSRITFFLLLPCVCVLSLIHPPPLLLLHSDHSQVFDVWLIRIMAWRSVIWGLRNGYEFVVLQVHGRLMLCIDRDISLMVARHMVATAWRNLSLWRRWFHDLGEETRFRVCDFFFFCVYASVVFTFSCMKNMEVPWWWRNSRTAITVKQKIAVAADLWLWVSDVAVADRVMVDVKSAKFN